MKTKLLLLSMAMGLMTWGCSSGDDTETERVMAEGSDARPTWQMPNYDLYEQLMVVEVQLPDGLQNYASANDLMCASIGGEVRGVTAPKQVDGGWQFPLIVASNNAGANVQLSYYCAALHRIFTTDWTTFDASVAPTGTGGIYEPSFGDFE
jgi:hypothetical protein